MTQIPASPVDNTSPAPDPALHNGDVQANVPPSKSEMERAQEIADKIGAAVSEFSLKWGWKLLQAGAVVRESVEDIWAEAQSIRRGNKS
jgi:enoyl-CoA hydratase/carnithine racemase